MSRSVASPEIEHFIELLSRLPGLGPRSARRAALYLLNKKQSLMEPLGQALQETAQKIQTCPICANIDSVSPCTICRDTHRDDKTLIIVEDIAALWALERVTTLKAKYHVLGGKLSPLDGIGPDQLNIESLIARIPNSNFSEIILALNATIEGETTAYYLTDRLAGLGLTITRLAQGVPIGGELEYLDEGTLTQALKARQNL